MARKIKPKYLELRRRRWYAVLDVPKDVRSAIGKPRFVKSLETESLTEAEREVGRFVSSWKKQIEAARSGDADLLRAARAKTKALEWREDFARAKGEHRELLLDVLEDEAEDLGWKDPKQGEAFYKVVTGETAPTEEKLEQWLQTLDQDPKTIDMKRSDALRFCQSFPYTDQVSKRAVQRWADGLLQNEGLKATTVRRIISACRGYWNYLVRTGYAPEGSDPFQGAVAPKKKSKAEVGAQRKPFTEMQVVELQSAALESGDIQLARLIWFGMWTGCRIEEICSLRVSNVKPDRFSVEEAKSPAGWREVPLHPHLRPAVASWAAASADGYLFSNLPTNKYAKRSNAIGKRFGRLKKKRGYGGDYVFHSIRKTFVTQLENALVPEQLTADIVGHEKRTITYGLYSGGFSFEKKLEAIRTVHYPADGIDEALLLSDESSSGN